jgi:hypothetical protein
MVKSGCVDDGELGQGWGVKEVCGGRDGMLIIVKRMML